MKQAQANKVVAKQEIANNKVQANMVGLANKVTIANKLQLLEEEVANKLQRNKEGGNMLLCNKLLPNKLLHDKLQGNKE